MYGLHIQRGMRTGTESWLIKDKWQEPVHFAGLTSDNVKLSTPRSALQNQNAVSADL